MEETSTNPMISTANPGTDARGISETSFVEALAHPACVFHHQPPLCNLVWVPCVRSQKRTRLLGTNPSIQLVGPNAVRCNGLDEMDLHLRFRDAMHQECDNSSAQDDQQNSCNLGQRHTSSPLLRL